MENDHILKVISHQAVMRLLSLAEGRARQLNIAITAVVIDSTGRLRGKLVMDGASIIADDIVEKKARAALLGLTPEALSEAMAEQPLMAQSLMQGGGLSYLPGAKAVYNESGAIIGALAIGGADVKLDVQCLDLTLADFC